MAEIQRVPGAGVVDVIARVGGQPVIGRVVDALEGQGRPQFVPLGGVVVDDVQQHLDPGLVKAGHHLLELGDPSRPQIARVGREKTQRVVTPIIAQPLFQQATVIDEGVDRQQFHRRHTKGVDVVDHLRHRQAGETAAQRRRHGGVPHGVAPDMRFVDHGPVPRGGGRAVAAPGEGRVDHHAFGHARRVVAAVERQVAARRADTVAEMRVRPAQWADDLPRVRVEQQLVRVETVTRTGFVGAMHPIAVDGSGARVGKIAVPDLVGVFGQRDAFDLAAPFRVEQAEFNLGGVGGEQGEIDPQTVPQGTERVGQSLAHTRATESL